MSKKPGRTHSRAASAAASAPPPWSVPLKADLLAETGLRRAIEASVDICAAVAALAAVRAVSDLKASFELSRAGEVVHVTGRVTATVGQNCVVSLEPIETAIDETIDVLFAAVPAEGSAAGEERRRKTENEPAEPLIDGTVDLGTIATEFLILGIEPYPRKEGVEFAPLDVDTEIPHPFAALQALKKSPDGDQS
ncbi:MAG: DUF177 domain-containing protein [Hyphomicrobiales bacterium]|nr:DUF177 domain-containing protein [Hyphomicrobiales bacterium]